MRIDPQDREIFTVPASELGERRHAHRALAAERRDSRRVVLADDLQGGCELLEDDGLGFNTVAFLKASVAAAGGVEREFPSWRAIALPSRTVAETPARAPRSSFGVILDAHPGEGGDLAAAPAWDATVAHVWEACLLGVSLARREIRTRGPRPGCPRPDSYDSAGAVGMPCQYTFDRDFLAARVAEILDARPHR